MLKIQLISQFSFEYYTLESIYYQEILFAQTSIIINEYLQNNSPYIFVQETQSI